MARIIKNFGEFAQLLKPQVVSTLEKVANDVKKEIDKAINKYYSEYDPSTRQSFTDFYYKRTDQLRDCCKVGEPKISGNTISIEVYLDIDSINYESSGADAYKTVVAANAGLHGGWNTSSFASGQVTWGSISDNDGSRWGSGTQIWEEPVRELFDSGKLIDMFKRYARTYGLNVR